MRAELGVGLVSPQQPGDDGLVHVQCLAQQRGAGWPCGHALQDVVPEQRGVVGKAWQHQQPVRARFAQQVEHQVDARPLAGDVVLQVAIDPFVAQVERRGQADQEGVEVEAVEAKGRRQLLQAKYLPLAMGRLGQRLRLAGGLRLCLGKSARFPRLWGDRLPPVRAEGPLQQRLGLGIADVQPAEGVAGILTGQLPAVDRAANPRVNSRQLGLQIPEAEVALPSGTSHLRPHAGSWSARMFLGTRDRPPSNPTCSWMNCTSRSRS